MSGRNGGGLKDIEVRPVDLLAQERMLSDPQRMDKIFVHLASGGTLTDYCELVGQPYSELMVWINGDQVRKLKYEEGKKARQEWLFERVLEEYKALSMLNLSSLYDENGALRPSAEWGKLGACIAGVESMEVTEMVDGEKVPVGTVKKVKLYDKTKTLEAMGRYLKMFTDVLEIRGEVSLKAALEDAERRVVEVRSSAVDSEIIEPDNVTEDDGEQIPI